MVHTYLGSELEETLERARGPFMNYMRAHVSLLRPLMKSLGINEPSKEQLELVVEIAFERYSRTASLIGTPESCLPLVQRLHEMGVNEIACLIDWMESEGALAALPSLDQLRGLAQRRVRPRLQALRNHLAAQLPHYMMPGAFVFLDSLPLTPNGKIDRQLLPAPGDDAYAKRGYEPPRTALEAAVADIWAEVLKRDRVGIHDNFFAIGGHSLGAVVVLSRIRKGFNIELPLTALFEAPTVLALAERIEAAQGQTATIPAPAIVSVAREGAIPLSFAQQRLWFLDQLEPDSRVLQHAGGGAACRAGSMWRRCARTLDEIVRRHEVLRTHLRAVDGAPVQVIAPELKLAAAGDGPERVGRRRSGRRGAAAGGARGGRDAIRSGARPAAPRAAAAARRRRSTSLLLTMHHIVADGWSMGVFIA